MEGMPGDWIFIDWANGLSKKGELSFEQLLLCRSLETMALCANIANDSKGAANYGQLAADLRSRLFGLYWNDSKQALVHSRIDGRQTDNVTRYTNMFAIFFDYFNDAQKMAVKKSVLLNDSIQQITTPYMRFYELEALCAMGEQFYVLKQMKDYWGGMLQQGATTFWEEYDPAKKGTDHYAMYGRPFGKSLCHAWGASPIYLLGKYYLGVKPTGPGYASYTVEPSLGGLQWMQGKVPTPTGVIDLYCSTTQVKIKAGSGTGILKIKSKTTPSGKNITLNAKGGNTYEITIQPGVDVLVTYKAL
jgi:alpha-L-rhamnosidase